MRIVIRLFLTRRFGKKARSPWRKGGLRAFYAIVQKIWQVRILLPFDQKPYIRVYINIEEILSAARAIRNS